MALKLILLGVLLLLAGCSELPPQQPKDLCQVFREKKDWYAASHRAAATWGIAEPLLMATVAHESGYRAAVRPARTWYLGFIPGPRASDAYGYAQAREAAWRTYRKATGHVLAERDNFADAVDFVGWYDHLSVEQDGIAPDDAYRLYLAYHEGQGGYRRGSYRNKVWLMNIARQVAASANRYALQLASCRQQLEAHHWWNWL